MRYFIAYIFLLLTMSGCIRSTDIPEIVINKPSLSIEFKVMNGADELSLDEAFVDGFGRDVKISTLKFYLSDIELISTSDERIRVSDVELIDFEPNTSVDKPQWDNKIELEVNPGDYKALCFGVGVKPEYNIIDPASQPNDHPLSLFSNMHWSWAAMYRFIVLEAKEDSAGDDSFGQFLAYHTGLDDLYRANICFDTEQSLKLDDSESLTFTIDWNDLFVNGNPQIDYREESTTHTTDSPEEFELAKRITENFVEAIRLKD